jgi:hypothetical protein
MAKQVILENCGSENNNHYNTGAKKQCLEGVTEKHYVAKNGFKFATLADFKDKAKWLEYIQAKDIVPLYEAYELAPENTEATFYETGNFKYETAPAVKKVSFESYLGLCSHRAVVSYNESSVYTQVFEFTNKGEIIGVVTDDGGIKGQELSSLNVGIRNVATKDKPAFTKVSVVYKDYKEFENNPAVIKPGFGHLELEGIYDVELTLVSATATSIKFTSGVGCSGGDALIKTLVDANIIVLDASGAAYTHVFVPADSQGIMEITGLAFANNFTINLDGVVTSGDMSYEAVEPLTITGI